MSNTPINTLNLNKLYILNKIKGKEENKEEIVNGSGGSTKNSINKYKIFKQMSFTNNNTDNIERNHSSINISKIKKYSKFRINKDDKNEKHDKISISKYATSKKLLIIFKNSEKCKNGKKETINESFKQLKKNEIESPEQKKLRFDNFGNIINKKNKKIVHIVFKDQINEKSIIEEIQIESFKKFNFIERLNNDVYNPNQDPFHKCCIIF